MLFLALKMDLKGWLLDFFKSSKNENKETVDGEYVIEEITDKNNNTVQIKLEEQKITQANGEEIILYESIDETGVFNYKRAKGIIKNIEDSKLFFLVKEENTTEDLENYHKDMVDVDDYLTTIDLEKFKTGCSRDTGAGKLITLNGKDINSLEELENHIGSTAYLHILELKDIHAKKNYNYLDIYINN